MRDSDPTLPAAPVAERTFYVINLCASPVPMPLEMPPGSGLEGLVVFRSHEVQDGRHRYRLHLGYFDSRAAAERALPQVQPRYPTAWIAAAPRARLGSLDDTGATDFRLIHAPGAKLQGFSTAEPVAPAPTAPAPQEAEEPQRYAVQLIWSSDRTEPSSLPPIALFDAYTLYTVTCQRGGVRLYGVRLGFFRSAISASQVAVYVRPDFPSVAVVPVSDREFAYASWLVRHRPGSRSAEQTAATQAAAPEPSAPTAPSALTAIEPPSSEQTPARNLKQPTQVEIAQIRSPQEVPLVFLEPVATPVSPTVGAVQEGAGTDRRPRHWAHQPRPPDLDREARIAALGA
ncbi:MAG TPA: hypothetical protein VFR59_03740, partial [Steroidobacteraceae bacterium]|nr:hypothetical protein [Steroidobacteraceae bacterium]